MGGRVLKVLVVAAVIATTASIAVGTYLRSQQICVQAILTPDRQPSEAEIRETVRILSERAGAYGEDFGVVRTSLRAGEDGRITAVFWAEREPEEFVKRFIQPGVMEFRFVAPKKGPADPADYEEAPWRQTHFSLKEPGEVYEKVTQMLVRKKPELCVTSFKSVSYHTEEYATLPVVTLKLHPDDAAAFNKLRRGNHGKELAVIIDGEVLVSAVIADGVETDRMQIRGIRGTEEAKRVAKMLEIGALPVKLSIEEIELAR